MKGAEHLDIRDVAGGAVIAVKAVAGASRDRVVGVLGDALKIATAAAPEKGKANRAIAATLTKALGDASDRVPSSAIVLLSAPGGLPATTCRTTACLAVRGISAWSA